MHHLKAIFTWFVWLDLDFQDILSLSLQVTGLYLHHHHHCHLQGFTCARIHLFIHMFLIVDMTLQRDNYEVSRNF